MNELPELAVQAKTNITEQPSPFVTYDETTKEFLSKDDPFWKKAVCEKFNWISVALKRHNYKPLASVMA